MYQRVPRLAARLPLLPCCVVLLLLTSLGCSRVSETQGRGSDPHDPTTEARAGRHWGLPLLGRLAHHATVLGVEGGRIRHPSDGGPAGVQAAGPLARGWLHQSTPLIVVLDPGHGGPYIGAADSTQTLVEKNLTLKVATRAATDLQTMGYRVFLTRTRDQSVNAPLRDVNHDGTIDELDDFNARTLVANRHHADVFVSIHFDASDPSVHGTHGYYCPVRPFWRTSLRLASLLTASVAASLQAAGYADPNNGVQTDVADKLPQQFPDYPWFFVLGPSWAHRITGTAMPGALIETLYLTSSLDDAALRRPGTIAAIARGYADGIHAYFGGRTRH